MTKIIDYGFLGNMGYITTKMGTTYLDWRMLQNILDGQGEIIGQEVEVIDGQVWFNSLTGI